MSGRLFTHRRVHNARVSRPVSRRVFVWLALVGVAGILIAGAFVIGARNHFEAVTLGYEGEDLRRQASQLEEKRRQLELERARAASPETVEREARKMGLARPRQRSDESSDRTRGDSLNTRRRNSAERQ
jgi:hypothetical protein